MQTRKAKRRKPLRPSRIYINRNGLLPSPPNLPRENPSRLRKKIRVVARWNGEGAFPGDLAKLGDVIPFDENGHVLLDLDILQADWERTVIVNTTAYVVVEL